ncbi:MAG: c-type cytochrome, partial [Nitrospira sp.]|nr:c-type cytochrome [Nitrospira sp.]
MRVQTLMSYWLCLSIAGLIGHVSSWAALADSDIQLGQKIYERSCVTCHGEFGKGDGPAAFYNSAYSAPRPRDFTVGNYKFRSTPS